MNSNESKLTCDWCDRIPRVFFEARKKKQKEGLVPTNLFYYACYVHRKLLEQVAEKKHGEVKDIKSKVTPKGY